MPIPLEYQQSQMQTQEVVLSTDVDGDSSSDGPGGEKRAHAQDAGAEDESGRRGSIVSADARDNPKSYKCNFGECQKAFSQKTHLEIHMRAHTGAKPYKCTHPTCHHAFSQLGNLKTHLRRHAGERPVACPTCGKTFAERNNMVAHTIVHDGKAAKKFVCRLDECGKCFALLGNLKSHMNKFHVEAHRELMARLRESDARGGGKEGEEDELLEYFRFLYRNANKGIKGRGKGRKVASTHNTGNTGTSPPSLAPSASLSSLASLLPSPPSSMSVSYTASIPAHLGARKEIEMFEGSSSGIGSLCASSSGSLYEVETYEEEGELAFEDRMLYEEDD
ncbi:hypothetical protein O988_02128 [Pseudogymnoascus sp. VKM F-3808]|nr:hypothetical protein O988_02128 [Pseudogymnoascus sp. VKM F-3808]